jgi:hypothetical protein
MSAAAIELRFTVATEAEAKELSAAWQEIIAGKKLPRLNTAATDEDAIMERARVGLQRIIKAIEDHPGTGGCGRLVRFLASMYNGYDYHFDLTDLRALDTELANACIDYLNYDRLGKAEVHTHLPGRGRQIETWFDEVGLLPRPRLDHENLQGHRLWALSKRVHRGPNELLREAVEDLLSVHENRAFNALQASRPPPHEERAVVHACRSDSPAPQKPLCGASDGPWTSRGFQFGALDCQDCREILLEEAKRSSTPE